VTPDAEAEGLWRNCRDSLAHGLLHFSDLSSSDYGFHNRKWIILSVHHAAEVFCNYLLRRADPSHPPRGRYPSLRDLIKLLQTHALWNTLAGTEREAVTDFFPPLTQLRNLLMHGAAPETLDVSDAAVAVLALLILVNRQTGAPTDEFLSQSPSIEYTVVDELRTHQWPAYTAFVERVVAEEYPGDDWIYIVQCDYCGGQTRRRGESECRACFHENDTTHDDD
jgi:hypothetical protein